MLWCELVVFVACLAAVKILFTPGSFNHGARVLFDCVCCHWCEQENIKQPPAYKRSTLAFFVVFLNFVFVLSEPTTHHRL